MVSFAPSHWRQRIREYKNDCVQTYFSYRIESVNKPYCVAFRSTPYRLLLVLSHMRSGSSLLTHVLTTNPELIGYGEIHTDYTDANDFRQVLKKVYWQAQDFRTLGDVKNLRMNHRYVVDKILHNTRVLSDDLLTSPQVYVIFLLREPERSLASIADLKPHWSQQDIIEYYASRMRQLVEYAHRINNSQQTLLLTYEQLLQQTPQVLTSLQDFLNTQTPFTEEYTVFKTTGMRGIGDHKGKIKAGRIVRSQRQLTQLVSPRLLVQANHLYQTSHATLTGLCQSIIHD